MLLVGHGSIQHAYTVPRRLGQWVPLRASTRNHCEGKCSYGVPPRAVPCNPCTTYVVRCTVYKPSTVIQHQHIRPSVHPRILWAQSSSMVLPLVQPHSRAPHHRLSSDVAPWLRDHPAASPRRLPGRLAPPPSHVALTVMRRCTPPSARPPVPRPSSPARGPADASAWARRRVDGSGRATRRGCGVRLGWKGG